MSECPYKFISIWQELKRRKAIHAILLYAVAAILILQLADIAFEELNLPKWALQFLIVLLCVGFILAAIFVKSFFISPKEIERTNSEEKVIHSVVNLLKGKLSHEEQDKLVYHPITNVKPYEYYLKAPRDFFQVSEEAMSGAIQDIQKAIDITGDNALLFFSLGYAYFGYENTGTKPDEFYLLKAEEYTQKIFELEPESYLGYFLSGLVQMRRGRLQDAVRHLKTALSAEPNDTNILFWLSLTYLKAGKTSAADPLVNRLLQLDSFTPVYQLLPGWLNIMDGKKELALEPCYKALNINPADISVRYYYALVSAFNKHNIEALALFDSIIIRKESSLPYSLLGKITKYALQCNRKMVLKFLTQEMIAFARKDEQYSWIIAGCLSLVNERTEALKWLENAVKKGCINYPFLEKYYPFLENIRGEENFKKLMERVKYEWEKFEI